MRIGVLGAGAVGGTLAALLLRAGHEVEVTARGEHLAAIRERGLRLEGGWGSGTFLPDAGDALRTRPEFAILATKAQDARDALAGSAGALQGVPILVVQNGLGGLREAAEEMPGSPLLGGLALFAASYLSPGRVEVTGPNPMILGAGPGCGDALLDRVAQVLRQALPIEVTKDLEGAQWTKLLINHVNALPAITGLSVQEVVAHPGLRRAMTASMRETVRVARALGVRFGTVQGVSGRILGLLGRLPLAVGEAFPRLLTKRMGDVPNPGSTLQSIRRGRRTEIDFLNGAVVAAAEAAGLRAPVNAEIVAMVHEVEESGAFIAPERAVERISRRR